MHVDRDIPSLINLAGEIVRIWYPNQPKTVGRPTILRKIVNLFAALILSALAIVQKIVRSRKDVLFPEQRII